MARSRNGGNSDRDTKPRFVKSICTNAVCVEEMAAEFGIPVSQKPQLTQFSILFCDFRTKPKTSQKFFDITMSNYNCYTQFYKYEKYPIIWDIELILKRLKSYEWSQLNHIKFKKYQTQGLRLYIGATELEAYPTKKQKTWLRKFFTFVSD